FCTLFGLGLGSVPALAQNDEPLVISTEEHCALNRVDDDNLPLALDSCRSMAEADDMQAQFEMGEFYYHGERSERELEQALKLNERAASQGHLAAPNRPSLTSAPSESV